jgi:hypothetical protein
MNITESTLQTTAIYSDDNQHRYLLRKVFNPDQKKAVVIMKYPCAADINKMDVTTMLVQNNLLEHGFGSIDIINLYSKLNAKLSDDPERINTDDNDKQIIESAEQADNIIICYGTAGDGSKKVAKREKALLKMLLPFKDKVLTTQDGRGKTGLHPLTPSLRARWMLVPFDFPELTDETEEQENPNTDGQPKVIDGGKTKKNRKAE